MPLMIQLREGRSAPVFVCDHCQRVIERATDGNMMWQLPDEVADKDRTVYPTAYTHKACCQAFERARLGVWCAEELIRSMLYLSNNLSMDDQAWKYAEDTAQILATLE